MRQYRMEKSAFGWKVTGTGVFCGLIGLYSIAMLAMGNTLFWFILLVCAYQVFNTFVSLSNPESVTVGEDSITFSAYGRDHTYPLGEISAFHVKELDQRKKMYVRVNEPTLLRGRYWVHCGQMPGGAELWDYFAWLEYQKDPGQLKFRTRIPQNPCQAQSPEEPPKTTQEEEKTNGTTQSDPGRDVL